MEFDRGMAGVLVVVLSLIASVGLGVITNIDTTTVQKDVDEYVADITGGFTSNKQRSYTEYNPSSNYNGYTNSTVTDNFAVGFEESSYSNNYPISYSGISGQSTAYTSPTAFTDIQTDSQYSTMYGPGYAYFYPNHWVSNADYDQLYHEMTTIYGPSYTTPTGYIKSINLYNILSKCVQDGTTVLGAVPNTIEITIPYTVHSVTLTVPYTYYNFNQTVTIPYLDNNVILYPSTTSLMDDPPDPYSRNYLLQKGSGTSYSMVIKYTVQDNSNHLFTAYIDDVPVYSGSANNYSIYYCPFTYTWSNEVYSTGYGIAAGYPSVAPHGQENPLPNTVPYSINVEYKADTLTKYIDTRFGVGIRNNENVNWTNNQQNGRTTLAFSVWSDSDKSFTDMGSYSNTAVLNYHNNNLTDTFTITRSAGYTYISLNGGSVLNIGTWEQVQIVIDNLSGQLIAYPISTWDNFNNYSTFGTSIIIGTLQQSDLSSIDWTANTSFRLQVTSTDVFFNSYGVVMVDPQITISDLWPNYTKFVVSFDKVASVGESITFGNVTYKIINNELNTITINEGLEEYTPTGLQITELSARYTQNESSWDITLESGKNTLSFTTTTTEISMTGAWYFIAGFYNVITKEVTERTWNPSTYNWFESNMFFWMAGFVLLLGLGAYKLGYLDGISILIIIASEFILIIIGGAT